MSKVDIRDASRLYLMFEEEKVRNSEALRTGALLRLADSVEVMCKNTRNLELERDQYRSNWHGARKVIVERDRTISALKGQITKLKKQNAALKGES